VENEVDLINGMVFDESLFVLNCEGENTEEVFKIITEIIDR
jgi:hypothetical protein